MKKIILSILLALALCRGVSAQNSLIAHTFKQAADDTNTGTSPSIDTTGANLVIIGVSTYQANCTPTDSKSNTWTALTTYNGGFQPQVKLFYSYAGTVGSGHTFSCSQVSTYPTIWVLAFAGAVASPYDVENGAGVDSGTTLSTGSVTPTADYGIVVTVLTTWTSAGSNSVDNGFTIADQAVPIGGGGMGGASAYKFQTAAAAVNPQWTFGSGMAEAATIASFKGSTSGGGGGTSASSRAMSLGIGMGSK